MKFSEKQRDPFFELLELLREGRITKSQLQQLESIVLGSPEAMSAYLRYMAIVGSLRQRLQTFPSLPRIVNDPPTSLASSKSHQRVWQGWKFWTVGAVLSLTGLVLALTYFSTDNRSSNPNRIGRLQTIQGQVVAGSAEDLKRPATRGTQIVAGDSIQTSGLQSLVVLVRPDGTRFTLFGNTSITWDSTASNRLIVHKGALAAQVEPQPADLPLELVTTEGTIRVLGTELVLESASDQTEVVVTKGRVRFIRSRDGKSVEVPEGKRVVEGPHSEMVISEIAATPDSWRVDFESGLPAGWKLGRAVQDELPAGSTGAVASMADPREGSLSYGIVTNHPWMRGLFGVRKNSCLNFTYKLDQPGWIQIFLGTRPADLVTAKSATVYLLEPWDAAKDERWWDVPAGKWHTVRIPLSKFFDMTDRNAHVAPGEVCFGLTFSSQEHERGLVIDQMGVTADGPQTVEIKAIP